MYPRVYFADWSAKEERWGRGPSKQLVHPRRPGGDAGTSCWTVCFLSRICLSGSGASIAKTSSESLLPTLLMTKLYLLVLCPGPVAFWTSSVLSCGRMWCVYNKPSLLCQLKKKKKSNSYSELTVKGWLIKTIYALAVLTVLKEGLCFPVYSSLFLAIRN
jgi:hypothetical protein